MSTWSIDIGKWVERTKADMDTVVRKIALELTTRIVLRSPVGNPELWAANAQAMADRQNHNVRMDVAFDFLQQRTGTKTRPRALQRRGQRALAKLYPLKSGKGYVGGRFRGAWEVTVGMPSTTEPGRIDPSGGETIGAAHVALANYQVGPSIFITNSVPYAGALEYGHSKQAPQGVVRLTVAEFQSVVDAAARDVQSNNHTGE